MKRKHIETNIVYEKDVLSAVCSDATIPNNQGFTLIELLVVLSIMAMFIFIGLPEYTSMTSTSTTLAAAHVLKEDLDLARSAADSSGGNELLCPSNDPASQHPSCGTNWSLGWVVLPATSSCVANGQTPTQIQTATHNTISFIPNGGTSSSVCFNRTGMPDVGGVWTIVSADGDHTVCVSMNITGHDAILSKGQVGCA